MKTKHNDFASEIRNPNEVEIGLKTQRILENQRIFNYRLARARRLLKLYWYIANSLENHVKANSE